MRLHVFLLLCLACLLCIPQSVAQEDAYTTWPTHFGDFKFASFPAEFKPVELLQARQWDDLQARLDELMASDARTADYLLHHSLAINQISQTSFAALVEDWHRERPQSYAAKVALGRIRIDQAWQARGSGWASTVSPENFIIFKQRLEQARELLEQAVSLRPDRVEAYTRLLTVGMGLGLPDAQRRAWFEKARAASPVSYSAYSTYMQGITQRWGGSNQAVHIFVTEAIQQGPAQSRLQMLVPDMHRDFAFNSGMGAGWYAQPAVWMAIDEAYRKLKQAQDGYLSPEDRTALARYALHGKDMQRAREQLDKLGVHAVWNTTESGNDPDTGNWPSLKHLITDRFKVINATGGPQTTYEQQWEWYLTALDSAIQRFPESAGLIQLKSEVLRERGDASSARMLFDDYASKTKDTPQAHHYVGTVALGKFKDPARALVSFEASLKLDPSNVTVQCDRVIALVQLDRGPEALEAIRGILAASPSNAEKFGPLINNYWRAQKFQLGIDHLPTVIEGIPAGGSFETMTVQAYWSLSLCQDTLTQYVDARQTLLKAVEKYPRNVTAQTELSRSMIMGLDPTLRDYPAGIEHGLLAMRFADKPDHRVAVMVARGYELNKQPDEAIALYQQIKAYAPSAASHCEKRIKEIRSGNLLTE